MAGVSVTERIAASADRVWGVIGDFGGLVRWLPAIAACTVEGHGIGAVRTLGFVGADVFARERLDAHDDAARSYTYTVVGTDLPIAAYNATMTVAPDGDAASLLHWSSSFTVTADGDENEVATMIERTYRDGIANVRTILGV
ncbi:MAG: SRPBCC family protein [Alphaproteobacteria bacterium]